MPLVWAWRRQQGVLVRAGKHSEICFLRAQEDGGWAWQGQEGSTQYAGVSTGVSTGKARPESRSHTCQQLPVSEASPQLSGTECIPAVCRRSIMTERAVIPVPALSSFHSNRIFRWAKLPTIGTTFPILPVWWDDTTESLDNK